VIVIWMQKYTSILYWIMNIIVFWHVYALLDARRMYWHETCSCVSRKIIKFESLQEGRATRMQEPKSQSRSYIYSLHSCVGVPWTRSEQLPVLRHTSTSPYRNLWTPASTNLETATADRLWLWMNTGLVGLSFSLKYYAHNVACRDSGFGTEVDFIDNGSQTHVSAATG
jgi:hypothetical protein